MAYRRTLELMGNKARRLAPAAVTAWCLLGGTTAVHAHLNQPDQGDTSLVHSCIKKSGVVRVINGSTQDCLKTETRTHWDMVGPPGPQGQQGDTGLAGEPGIGILGGATGTALLAGTMDQFVGSFNAGRSRTEGDVQLPIPAGGTFSNLYVVLSGPPGATGRTWTFVVRNNAGDTAVTCTIQDPAISCSDLAHMAVFDSGDLFSIRVIGGGNPTVRFVQWTAVFQPD